MNHVNTNRIADLASDDVNNLLVLINKRAERGDRLMALVAEHIEKLEDQLKTYKERFDNFA